MPRRTVELELYRYAESDNAYLVGETIREPDEDESGGKWWLPKSVIEDLSEPRADGCRTYEVHEWWAEKNGLV